jgi:hypothetical protein
VGNSGQNAVYLNDGAEDFSTALDFGTGDDETYTVALGDVNEDGALDLVVGNYGQSAIYLSDGAGSFPAARDFGPGDDNSRSVVLGDVNGDGALDLVVGNDGGQNAVYLNDGTEDFSTARDFGTGEDWTRSVAVGDVNGDGALDLVVGNYGRQNAVYLNDGAGNFRAARDFGTGGDHTWSVALGDVNGDGAPDLVVGNFGQNAIYLNRSRLPERLPNNPPSVVLTRPGSTGDANFYSTAEILAEPIIPITYTLFDPDGDRVGRIAAYYSPDGGGRWLPAVATSETVTTDLSLGTHTYHWDIFQSGFFGQSDNVVLRLEAYPQPSRAGTAGTYRYTNNTVGPYQWPYAAATTFPFRVRGTQVRVYSETVTVGNEVAGALVYHLPQNQTAGAAPLADTGGTPFRTNQYGYLLGRGTIRISDTLFALLPVSTSVDYAGALAFDGVDDYVEVQDPFENDTAFTISLWVRPALIDDGRYHGFIGKQGDWRRKPGMWLAPTQGGLHYDSYDLSGNRYYGVLDDFFPSAGEWVHVAWVKQGTAYRIYRDGVLFATRPAPERFFTADTSYWIGRVDNFWSGLIDEVRIWNVARSQAEIKADMYLRLKGDEPGLVGYWPFDDPDIPSSGWCRDQTANGNDGLLHGPTWQGGSLGGYTVYHTSAAPTPTGLAGYTVREPGVQALAVTADHPLILFDLNVSLEWDARQDTAFLEQLRFDLKRASEILFDATNGQAALGEIVVYHDRQRWLDADLRVYATNAMRPNAAIGGLRTGVYTEVVSINPYAVTTLPYTLTYRAGQVRMGSLWNRFGEASGTLGEDWPRTLAHELGHYFFYLYDNYIGLDENGIIGPAEGCFGSLMTNPYLEDYSEFHPAARWGEQCAQTLSAQRSGRADWETIVRFYPWLDGTHINDGPSALPLTVTRIHESEITPPPTTLDVPIFYLTAEEASYQPGGSAQAILFQGDRLIDLGRPSLDKVRAWGARPGDRLCVYEPDAARLGCEEIEAGDNQLALVERAGWQPEVIVTPVTSRTVAINVTVADLPADTLLKARLYPSNARAGEVTTLSATSAVAYSGTFTLDVPAGEGYIQLWVDEDEGEGNPRRETVTNYALGGNPGFRDLGFGFRDLGFGFRDLGFGFRDLGFGFRDLGFGFRDLGFAPTASTDGQLILYGDVEFEIGQFYALQKATSMPDPLPWATLVGDGYWLMASPNAPDFAGTSLNFRYLGKEVPPGEERFLSLYYWDGGGWEKLPTRLNPEYNEASAPTQGLGLYALMSSLEIPLYQAGWNLFAYPVAGTRPVAEALRSIEGYYNTVYGYAVADTTDPWKVYGWGVPDWVNDLQTLHFGQGYWINVTEPLTLYLKGGTDPETNSVSSLPQPPATYYGAVLAGPGFTPSIGLPVTAWVGSHLCGQARTQMQALDGQTRLVYAIDILAEDWDRASGCGAPGRWITFEVGGQPMATDAVWNNDQVTRWDLGLDPSVNLGHRLHLPLILKRHGSAPDLVVQGITAASRQVQVIIANQGDAPVANPFWVDVYIDPDPPPSVVNQIWNDLADQGLVWGVTRGLAAGEVLTLMLGDPYYWADYSQVAWPLSIGTPVYAQVDAVDLDTAYGSVLEGHEMRGGVYNNVGGPVYVQAGVAGEASPQGSAPAVRDGGAGRLPPRP